MKVKLGHWQYLEKLFPKKNLEKQAVDWLDRYKGPIGIACSGGSDSLILLLLIKIYWPENRCFLLHFNHKIRKQSDLEESYLKNLADILNISFISGYYTHNTLQTETALREARYTFLEKYLHAHSIKALLLGQHEDDVIETVLMRLFRGCSLDGIVAPRAVHPLKTYTKIRPLLTIKKIELQSACEQCGIHYFVDHTNFDDICIRNRLRNHILPKLNDVFKGINWRKGFKRTCTNFIEQRKFLACYEKNCLENSNYSNENINPKNFLGKTYWEQILLLRHWLQKQGINDLSFEHLEYILSHITHLKTSKIALTKTHYLLVNQNSLKLEPTVKISPFFFKWLNGTIFFPQKAQLSLQKISLTPDLYKKITSGYYKDTEKVALDINLEKGLYVRNWINGDRYQPIGFSHEKKVKNLFADRKINSIQRKQLPVITNIDGKIIWIPGLPPAECAKVKTNTKLCIFLIYKKK